MKALYNTRLEHGRIKMKDSQKEKKGTRPMKAILPVIILTLLLCLCSCKERDYVYENVRSPDISIKTDSLVEFDAKINDTQNLNAPVKEWNQKDNEIYVIHRNLGAREYLYHVQDFDTLEVKRTLHLPIGDMQSPTCYYSPTHFEYLDGRYYVIDQFSKIVVYDHDFKFLFASMYDQFRTFIDFFKCKDRVMFVIGTTFYGKRRRGCEVKLFTLPDGRKPVLYETLFSFSYPNIHQRYPDTHRYDYRAPIFPSAFGFEKNGKIYLNDFEKNVFREYDPETRKITKIELPFLKRKKFTDQQVSKFSYFFGDGYEDSFKRKFGKEVVYKAFWMKPHYFGLIDAGKNKIGIIGDIDLDKRNKYRLDIIDCKTKAYINSIWFPIGSGFHSLMGEDNSGVRKIFHDVDKKIVIWDDRVGEEREFVMHISKYQLVPIGNAPRKKSDQ